MYASRCEEKESGGSEIGPNFTRTSQKSYAVYKESNSNTEGEILPTI